MQYVKTGKFQECSNSCLCTTKLFPCNQVVDKRMSFVAKLSNDVTVKYHLEDKRLSHCKNAKHMLTF